VKILNDLPPSIQSMHNIRIVDTSHEAADRLEAAERATHRLRETTSRLEKERDRERKHVARLMREKEELRAKIKDQTDAGYCDAQHLSDGPPYRCGWQQRAKTAERQLAERDADLAQEKAHSENFEQYWRDTEAAMARVCAEVLQVQADIALKHADYDGMDKSDLRYWMIAIDAALAGSGDGWPVPIVCDVLTIQHSSGYPDHFTRIKRGDRQLTIYMSKIKGQCEYHAAEFDWLLNGATKPDILAFDDTEPEGLSDYLKSLASPSTAGER
jgi:hypothetical protein